MRANVPGSGPGWRGAHFVWGGPCVGPRAHTKWASQIRPLLGPQGDLAILAVLSGCVGPVLANGAGPLGPIRSPRGHPRPSCAGMPGPYKVVRWACLVGGPACLVRVRGLDRSLEGRARACLGPRACARARPPLPACLPAQGYRPTAPVCARGQLVTPRAVCDRRVTVRPRAGVAGYHKGARRPYSSGGLDLH